MSYEVKGVFGPQEAVVPIYYNPQVIRSIFRPYDLPMDDASTDFVTSSTTTVGTFQ